MSTVNFTPISDGSTADAADVNTPLQTIYDEFNGNIDNANIASGAAISGSKIAGASIDLGAKGSVFDGWILVSDSWSYASATTITVPTDATTKYAVGDKIKLVQSATTKYFYITAVSSTVLTVTGGSDYTVANSAISGIYYSKAATPQGFPQWFNYTPSYTNMTVGNGTVVAKFTMVAKIVDVFFSFTLGSTSSISGIAEISAPTNIDSDWYAQRMQNGGAFYNDATGADIFGYTKTVSSTNIKFNYPAVSGSLLAEQNVQTTQPFTWATSDNITSMTTYEAA